MTNTKEDANQHSYPVKNTDKTLICTIIKKNKPKQEDKLNHEYKKDKSIVQEKSYEIVDKNQQSADQDKNNKKPRKKLGSDMGG